MMNCSNVAVLDIGSTKVAAMVAELDASGPLRVLGHACQPCEGVRKGMIASVDEVLKATQFALQGVEQQIGHSIGSVVMSISGRQAEATRAQGIVPIFPTTRKINRDDVLQVINHSRQAVLPDGREMVQAIPSEFRVDGRFVKGRPLGESGSKLEVKTFLVSATADQINVLEKITEKAGKTIDQFVFEPLASGLGVLGIHQLETGSAVVDIGGDTTVVGVFRGGSIIDSATIPIGGRHVTSDVAHLLRTTPEEAEAHKVTGGCALGSMVAESESIGVMQVGQIERRPMQRRVFCEIIEARMREIANMVRAFLVEGSHLNALPGGVALTGGGSLLKGADELFDSVLAPVRVKLAVPHLKGHHSGNATRPEMSVTAGLARFALECCQDELAPATADNRLSDRFRTMLSLLGGKS